MSTDAENPSRDHCDRLVDAVNELTETAGSFDELQDDDNPLPSEAVQRLNRLQYIAIKETDRICKLLLGESAIERGEIPDAMAEIIAAANALILAAFKLERCDIPPAAKERVQDMAKEMWTSARALREQLMPGALSLEQSVLRDIENL